MVCGDGKGGRCRSKGVTYEMSCKGCEGRYIGETSRNGFTRGREHKSVYQKRNRKSPLFLHNEEQHGMVPVLGFEMRVIGVFGDATKRQVQGSVLIQKTETGDLINRRDVHEAATCKLIVKRVALSMSH